jgi:repressor LexA
MTFGDRLKQLRIENGLTMDDFIGAINKIYPDVLLNKSIVSRYENNIHTPKKFTIVEQIADFFGVSINYMMGRSDSRYGEDTEYKRIPILGTIAAGIPITAQEDILGYEYVLPDVKLDFCLKVKGNSMIGARIFDGDIVCIRRQEEVENGEIAAIQIDGEEATLKRFYKDNGRIILHSENPTVPDMVFMAKDRKTIKVLGKVIYVKFEVR